MTSAPVQLGQSLRSAIQEDAVLSPQPNVIVSPQVDRQLLSGCRQHAGMTQLLVRRASGHSASLFRRVTGRESRSARESLSVSRCEKRRLIMRTVILLLAAVVASAVVGQVAAMPRCSQIDSGWCIGNEPCPHWVEFRTGYCVNNLKEWRCCWGFQLPDCFYWCSSWEECWCGEGEPPFPCDCLLEGTPITLADGTTKPVEGIMRGDLVLSYDELAANRTAVQPSEVIAVYTPFIRGDYFIINERIRVTGAHPMLSGGKWVAVDQLRVGDALTAADGSDVPIISLRKVDEAAVVYNLKVALGTYVAYGVIVHNKEDCKRISYGGW